ncbi:hypothetical protein [Streptomyces sp. NPDC005533]|uniref:hypothetical protein n=1 Tax=Streptomyces sp. NPDC005533 TaxID=3364723 RepID=UPI00367C8298
MAECNIADELTEVPEECLDRSYRTPDEIGIAMSSSISRTTARRRHQFESSFARRTAQELGTVRAIPFDVSHTCSGLMTGVCLLVRMIRAGEVRRKVVLSKEPPIVFTATREMEDSRDPRFSTLSVGDSAVAVVADRATDDAAIINDIELVARSEYSHSHLYGMPSDETGDLAIYTNIKEMQAENCLSPLPAFHRDSRFADDVDGFVVQHQVGSRFIDLMIQLDESVFTAPTPPSLSVVDKSANTPTSHCLALHQVPAERRTPKGSKVLLMPAASGVVTSFLSATASCLEV